MEGLKLVSEVSTAAGKSGLADKIAAYVDASRKAQGFLEPLEEALLWIGQAQLLQGSLCSELRALLQCALTGLLLMPILSAIGSPSFPQRAQLSYTLQCDLGVT